MEDVEEALHAAVVNGRTDVIKGVLETLDPSSADSSVDENGSLGSEDVLNRIICEEGTLLHLAVKLDKSDVVRALISSGADPGIQNLQSQTPIDLCTSDRMKTVFKDELFRATAQSQIGRVCQLLAAGLNINTTDSNSSKNTPLHWAASFSNRDTIEALLDRGADVNAMNSLGATPLLDSLTRQDVSPLVVKCLMQSGADPNLKGNHGKFHGKSAIDVAHDMPELLPLLRTSSVSNGLDNPPSPVADQQLPNGVSKVPLPVIDYQSKRTPSIETLTSIGADSIFVGETPKKTIAYVQKEEGEVVLERNLRPLITNTKLHMLWPQPRNLQELGGLPWALPEPPKLSVSVIPSLSLNTHKVLDEWQLHHASFSELGYDLEVGETIGASINKCACNLTCSVNHLLLPHPDGYRIYVTSTQLQITAADAAGLHYAICTFLQLLKLCKEDGIPAVNILDYPNISHRAVMLDMSPHGRVPTLGTLTSMVQTLASLKINHVHLYSPFAAKPGWQLPLRPRELISLDRICWERHIRLVPVLDLEQQASQSSVLTQTWESIRDFLACFSQLEWIGIGPRLSSVVVETGELNMDLLYRHLPLPAHSCLMLCAYPFNSNVQLLKQVPPNVLLLHYGFHADQEFVEPCQAATRAGCMVGVCVGTAAWNSLCGCPDAAVSNIYCGCEAALEVGAVCVVAANWAGAAHLTPLSASWPPLLIAAGLAWKHISHWDFLHSTASELCNLWVWKDSRSVTGSVVWELGTAETYLHRVACNTTASALTSLPPASLSALRQILLHPDTADLQHLTAQAFNRVLRIVKRCQAALDQAAPSSELVTQELHLSIEMMLIACRVGRSLLSVGQNPHEGGVMGLPAINPGVIHLPPTFRTDAANKLLEVVESFRRVWLSQNLPPGLQGALLLLNAVLQKYIPQGHSPQ